MRKRTKQAHDKSDKAVNLRLGLILTNPALYAEGLSLFGLIYQELEDIMERNKEKDPFRSLYPTLSRLGKRSEFLRRDVKHFLKGDETACKELWQRRQPEKGKFDPPELHRYIMRIRTLEKADSPAIISYFYHLHMALLAGGFFVQKAVRRAFSLSSDRNDGVELFCFTPSETYPTTASIRNKIKSVVNDFAYDEDTVECILKESVSVFSQNDALVNTVQDSPFFANAAADFKKNCAKWTVIVIGVVAGVLAAGWKLRNPWISKAGMDTKTYQ